MKKVISQSVFSPYTMMFFVFWVVNVLHFNAQVQYGGKPVGVFEQLPYNNIETVTFPLTEKMISYKNSLPAVAGFGEAMHAGFTLVADVDPVKFGTWDVIGDTLHIWRLKINSPYALAMGVVFDGFKLPENSRMFVYSEDKQFIIGAFDYRNNNNVFISHIIPGDNIIIEYETKIDQRVSYGNFEDIPFNISEIIHISNGSEFLVEESKSLDSSDFCQVNINCPEGDKWQNHKRSVVRMLMRVGDSYYWCTGALVNNSAQDGKPYILSAAHCGDGANYQDMVYWHFYFNYERPECENTGIPNYNMLHGCELISYGPLKGGSDFRLLLLREPPPAIWQPYFSGWSLSDTPSNAGVGIHHPSGDAKKISTYDKTLVTATPTVSGERMADNSTWKVEWKQTETHFGVPQGGSSGSPLFNSQGLIIGTLTGGSSDCTSPQNPDYYGKMSFHWESNDNGDASKQLKPYLDPIDQGANTLQGYDPYFNEYPPPGYISANSFEPDSIELFWYKPGSAPNKRGWYSHVNHYSHLTWESPERAILFDAKDFEFTFPVTLTRVSHYFVEHPDHQWPNNKFTYRIYDSDGVALLYESEQLTATHMQEMIYTLEEPMVLDEKFYVAVRPVHNSGHPSTLMLNVNYGTGNSFFGSADDWTPYVDIANNQEFEFFTKIYITDSKKMSSEISAMPKVSEKDAQKHYESNEITKHGASSLNYNILNISYKNTPEYYKIYRDDELISQTENSEKTSIVDDDIDYGLYTYHITSVYSGDVESIPSKKVYVFIDEPCSDIINQYPHVETFDGGGLDDCWKIINKTASTWQFSTGYTIDNVDVNPVDGSHFIYVPWSDDEYQDEWLVTAPINLSSVNRPALRFWFNGSYSWSVDNKNSSLTVYASIDGGAFHEIWNHTMHPEFNSLQIDYVWLQAMISLLQYSNSDNVRLAFHYKGKDGGNLAIDKIEIISAAGLLSTVTLVVEPNFSGKATGGGSYLAGERVSIKAEPNIKYSFVKWEVNDQLFSLDEEYSFIMPSNNKTITAMFSSILSVDDNMLTSEPIVGYPNPAKTRYNILFHEQTTNVTVSIFDLQGKKMLTHYYDNVEQENNLSVSLDGLAPGIYLVNVSSDKFNKTLKVSIID